MITQLVAGDTTEQVLDKVAEPVDVTATTSSCPVVVYVKLVAVGTDVIVYVPLNAVATPAIMTLSPTMKGWAVDVFRVATFEAKALRVMVAALKEPPPLVKVVTNIEVGGPTVPERAAAVGVTVTSVLPGDTATVGTPGASKFHCG